MSLKIRDIVEATGVFAVVAGLLLVAYQINQATNIASAQARADYSAGWRSVDGSKQSEDFAEVLVKSIYDPNGLTPSEMLELDGYYIGVIDQLQSAQVNWLAGVRTSDWQFAIDSVAHLYFGNEYSQLWWEYTKEGYAAGSNEQNDPFIDAVDAAIKAAEPGRQKRVIDALQKAFN